MCLSVLIEEETTFTDVLSSSRLEDSISCDPLFIRLFFTFCGRNDDERQ